MSPDRVLAEALTDLADANRWTPCQADPEPWVSDNYRDRRAAIEACATCPVLEPCRTAGQDHDYFVWGGVDRTRTTGRRTA